MILAHDLIKQIGMDLALELLDVIDSDALLRPELVSLVTRASRLLDHELGAEAPAAGQVKSVLTDALTGIQA